jgi:hypothetical protein
MGEDRAGNGSPRITSCEPVRHCAKQRNVLTRRRFDNFCTQTEKGNSLETSAVACCLLRPVRVRAEVHCFQRLLAYCPVVTLLYHDVPLSVAVDWFLTALPRSPQTQQ